MAMPMASKFNEKVAMDLKKMARPMDSSSCRHVVASDSVGIH